ncbi:MAG: hypothetical protein H6708_17660 [Kofleriaceae bacterium]|nr:hypothetical protein [Myxococcales bacterium]MCB9562235.1 hypothetical protein [Kofleriaceae bacterium]
MQGVRPTWRAHVLHGDDVGLARDEIDVDLSGATLDDRAWVRLCALGADVASLRMSRCGLGDDDLRRLRLLPRLRRLDLSGNPITDAGIAVLADHDQLAELSLAGTAVRGAGLATLPRTLRHLDATDAPLDGLEGLAGHAALQVLAASSAAIDDAQLAALRRCRLDRLSLRGTRVTGRGLAGLAPTLRFLDLAATRVTGDDVAGLGRFAALHALDLSTNHVGGAGLTALTALTALTRLALRHAPLDERDLEPLASMPRLRELALCDRRIPTWARARLKQQLAGVGPLTIEGCDRGAELPCVGVDGAVVPILRPAADGAVHVVATGVQVLVPTSIVTFGDGARAAKHGDLRILLPRPTTAAAATPVATVRGHHLAAIEPIAYQVAPDDEFEETSTPLAAITTAALGPARDPAPPAWRRGRVHTETLWADEVVVLAVGERVTLLAYPHGDVAEVADGLGPRAGDAEVTFAGGGAVLLRLDAPGDDALLGAVVVSYARGVPELAGMVVHVAGVDVTVANHGQLQTAARRRPTV